MSGVDQAAPVISREVKGSPDISGQTVSCRHGKQWSQGTPVISREAKRSPEISEQKVSCRDEPQKQQAE